MIKDKKIEHDWHLFGGPAGVTVFTRPLHDFFRENELPDLFNKTSELHDDRLLALVTALIVENRLDVALSSFLPCYSELKNSVDFTFSMKTKLAEALSFIPVRILKSANILRLIRNEFAHGLEKDSFEQLKPKLRTSVVNLRSEIFEVYGDDEKKPKETFLDEYKALSFYCIVGIDQYRDSLAFLRQFIEGPEFARIFEHQQEVFRKAVIATIPLKR